MPDLLVRNVAEDLVKALERRAAEHGRSTEDEHRAILDEQLRPRPSDFWERAGQLREETKGRSFTDSADLIRRDRGRTVKLGAGSMLSGMRLLERTGMGCVDPRVKPGDDGVGDRA